MADHSIYPSYQPLIPVSRPANTPINTTNKQASSANTTTFGQVLEQEISGVKFSQHAIQRLNSRSIQLDSSQLSKLNQAVDKAAQKGAKESLILMNNNSLALVVSVRNKTVITAMDGTNIKDNVFTNIDSAVIV